MVKCRLDQLEAAGGDRARGRAPRAGAHRRAPGAHRARAGDPLARHRRRPGSARCSTPSAARPTSSGPRGSPAGWARRIAAELGDAGGRRADAARGRQRAVRRRGHADAPQRADRARALRHHPLRPLPRAPRRHALDRQRRARLLLDARPSARTTSTSRPATESPEAILARVERGFYMDDQGSYGFNSTTGDYSFQAQGFWIEQGAKVFPVEGVTVASNSLEMLRNVVAVGNDLQLPRQRREPDAAHRRDDGQRRVARRGGTAMTEHPRTRGTRLLPALAGALRAASRTRACCPPASSAAIAAARWSRRRPASCARSPRPACGRPRGARGPARRRRLGGRARARRDSTSPLIEAVLERAERHHARRPGRTSERPGAGRQRRHRVRRPPDRRSRPTCAASSASCRWRGTRAPSRWSC